ncbi:MAG: amino acid transporter [Rhodothermales bacterium]
MSSGGQEKSSGGHQFGTFGGVFTPSILTIFGLIMFMRANYIVGTAGITQSLLILTLCCTITFLTGLSIAAISTNTPVSGGGAYFLISRVLGPGFGTAIGIALFLAQALSVPFYVLGFAEALVDAYPVAISFRAVCMITLVLLFVITWVGAGAVIKLQFVILAVLMAAIASFLIGAGLKFDPDIFRSNLHARYGEGQNLWTMFALYFPAVTGIMAGVNLSGDLKNPAKSIPKGTLAAIIVSYVFYAAQIFICGGLADSETLREQPFLLLVGNALFGLGGLVIAGVFCATISSAIGSYLGAPRVLQAVARDKTVSALVPFGKGDGEADEPRRALIVTFVIAGVTLLLVTGEGSEGGAGLNLVAALVSMVFLYTYGMTNLAAFVESFGANPSFRPRFRFFHWTSALAGAFACAVSAVMVNAVAAILALALLALLFVFVRRQEAAESYGDARGGFVYQRLRTNLLTLDRMERHAKNWRPTILIFSGDPYARKSLIRYGGWLGMNCGIVSVIFVVIGRITEATEKREEAQNQLSQFVREHRFDVIAEAVTMEDFDRDFGLFVDTYSIGPIKPNIVLFGWPRGRDRLAPYCRHLRTAQELGKSMVLVVDRGSADDCQGEKRIDCWWRGRQNGSLMVILAHLVMQCAEWRGTRLRLIRQVANEAGVNQARSELEEICHGARIDADFALPVSNAPFHDVLHEYSSDATLVMMGFIPPAPGEEESGFDQLKQRIAGLPSTILINSSGEADFTA